MEVMTMSKYNVSEVIQIGGKYYLNKDVQSVLEVRINSIDVEDIIVEESS